jgi:hypothetical protein
MNWLQRCSAFPVCVFLFAFQNALFAQTEKLPKDNLAVFAINFDAYKTCKFVDGLEVVEVSPLTQGITARTVDTSKGKRQIDLLAGNRIMFAYPNTDFYANLKVERLPAQNYSELKHTLIDNFDYLLASGDNERNYSLEPLMNGFDIRGLDRGKIEGGVVGVYLLFDDATHDVMTIYFLNQEPNARKFQTLEDYRRLRDQFLTTYTSCIRGNQASRTK